VPHVPNQTMTGACRRVRPLYGGPMTLTQINVWIDVLFVAIYLAVIVFLIWHFTMFIIKGRFRKSFIEGHWPEHDSRPPAAPKVMHAFHMFSMIILAITGMYLRFPFFYGGRVFMRNTHYVFMIIVVVVLVMRVWYAFYSKTNADWREFAIGKKDIATAGGVLKYYGYLSDQKPHVAKYNVMQKMSYSLFLVMMLAQAFTGFALLRYPLPFIGISPRDMLIGWWLAPAVGSAALAMWYVRMLHYILNWGFIIMTTVHFYLAFSVDIPCAADFFGIGELKVTPGGHGHDHDDAPDEPEQGVPAMEPAL
jgi:Ni/Fe-hydrogenase 1 B-type cytochrome subunit